MFSGDDEDDDFLSPAGGAKLASLFGVDQHMSQTNESFQYTAPKQPRKSSTSAPASQKSVPPLGAPAVLFGTAVQAFRYINGQYVKQGKLGLAVLGNHITKEYKLLLYLNQQKQVAAAKIHVGFVLTVQPNNYCTFYDDQRQNWSMMFDSEKALSDFCKEICLAKANSVASLDTVVIQDLSLGEGQAVDSGDVLEVLYTGWLLQNHTIGQMFDSNHNLGKLMRLKVGAGKVIKGLEDGMLGMKKSGRRFLIIPPNLAYGSKGVSNHVLSNSTLIFEADLCRVKFFKDSESDHTTSIESVAPSLARSPAPSVDNLSTEPAGPEMGQPPHCAKPHSLGEQLANPDATKAKLISRMAKMGQPMFPFLKEVANHPESSDSEVEDISSNRMNNQLAASSPVQISTAAPVSAHSVASTILSVPSNVAPQPGMLGSSHAFQTYPCTPLVASSQLHPAGQIHPAQTIPYLGDVTSFLITEARQHNTEIRQSIVKVADKVEQLTSKIDVLQRQGSFFMGSPSISVETSMIMYNIQRIVQENECLKREVLEKSSCIEKQNCKIAELITQNQRYMEHSDRMLENRNNFLKSSNEQCQVRLLEAEQEKVHLMKDLASSKAQLSQLHLEASTQQQKATELQTRLMSVLQSNESQSQVIAGLETKLKDVMEAAEKSQAQHRLEKQRCEEMEFRVHKIEEELEELKSDNERLEPLQVALEEEERKEKCVQTSAEKQHRGDLAKLAEHRDTLQDKLTELQDKYTVLEQHGVTVKKKLEKRVAELEKKLTEQESSRDTAAKVKQVMNGVFHSLRGEFDLCESYSGQAILEVILSTIKSVTLQLLSGTDRSSLSKNEEEKDKSDDVKQPEDTLHWNVPAKNEREIKEDHEAEPDPDQDQVSESYMEIAEEEGRVTESKTQSQVKKLIAHNIHQTISTNLKKMIAPGYEVENQQAENSASQISAGDSSTECENPNDYEPDRSSPASAGSNKRIVDDGGHVGEVNNTSLKGLRQPSSPPPISELQNNSGSYPSLTGQAFDNNGEIKPLTAPVNEEEEDDINLKGRPPSLFGDDDDPGWLD